MRDQTDGAKVDKARASSWLLTDLSLSPGCKEVSTEHQDRDPHLVHRDHPEPLEVNKDHQDGDPGLVQEAVKKKRNSRLVHKVVEPPELIKEPVFLQSPEEEEDEDKSTPIDPPTLCMEIWPDHLPGGTMNEPPPRYLLPDRQLEENKDITSFCRPSFLEHNSEEDYIAGERSRKRRRITHPEKGWEDWPVLGDGWKRRVTVRQSGATLGKTDVYYLSPSGDRLRSRVEMASLFGGDIDLSAFHFLSGQFISDTPVKVKREVPHQSSKEEDHVLICSKCGQSFAGTRYGKLRKKPYCAFCRASKKREHTPIPFEKIKVLTKNSTKKKGCPQDEKQTELGPEHKKKRTRPVCGTCHACLLKTDCGTCDFCKDKFKFGGSNRMRQKCRLRQCLRQAKRSLLPRFQLDQAADWMQEDGDGQNTDRDAETYSGDLESFPSADHRSNTDTDAGNHSGQLEEKSLTIGLADHGMQEDPIGIFSEDRVRLTTDKAVQHNFVKTEERSFTVYDQADDWMQEGPIDQADDKMEEGPIISEIRSLAESCAGTGPKLDVMADTQLLPLSNVMSRHSKCGLADHGMQEDPIGIFSVDEDGVRLTTDKAVQHNFVKPEERSFTVYDQADDWMQEGPIDQADDKMEEGPIISEIRSLAESCAGTGPKLDVMADTQLLPLLRTLRAATLPQLWTPILLEEEEEDGPRLQLVQCDRQSGLADATVLIDPDFHYWVTVRKCPLPPGHPLYGDHPSSPLDSVTAVVSLLRSLERYSVCQGFSEKPCHHKLAPCCNLLVKGKVESCVNCKALRG